MRVTLNRACTVKWLLVLVHPFCKHCAHDLGLSNTAVQMLTDHLQGPQ